MADHEKDQAQEHEDHGKKKKHGGQGHGGGGGHEEAHEGAPEWLISFADNVALMMGFFVILFALNITPTNRRAMGGTTEDQTQGDGVGATEAMLDFAISMRAAFNNPLDMGSTNPADQPLIHRVLQLRGRSSTTDPGIEGHEQDVQSLRPSDYYAISGSIPFGEHSVELTAAGRATAQEVAQKVRGVRLIVEVRGHASAAEAAGGLEQSMRLSANRAMMVAGELVEQGADWWQLRVVASGDHDRVNAFPSAPADDQANARVEVIITNEVVPDKVPMGPGAARRGAGR